MADYTLAGILHTYTAQPCHFKWSWVTAKYSMKRCGLDLCDSRQLSLSLFTFLRGPCLLDESYCRVPLYTLLYLYQVVTFVFDHVYVMIVVQRYKYNGRAISQFRVGFLCCYTNCRFFVCSLRPIIHVRLRYVLLGAIVPSSAALIANPLSWF